MALSPAKEAEAFFRFARRRTLVMMSTGVAVTIAGLVAATTVEGGAAAWSAVVVVVGLVVIVGSSAGVLSLREARRLLHGPSQQMDLRSWPYRSIRSPRNNRVLVTLDLPGSSNRTPLAEFTSSWFTPGAAEAPGRLAQVFGSLSKGRVVLAVADDGSCFIGRVVRTRA